MEITYNKLMTKKNWTEAERLLVQAVAALSTREGWDHMTPGEVFDTIKQQVEEVDKTS